MDKTILWYSFLVIISGALPQWLVDSDIQVPDNFEEADLLVQVQRVEKLPWLNGEGLFYMETWRPPGAPVIKLSVNFYENLRARKLKVWEKTKFIKNNQGVLCLKFKFVIFLPN